MIKVIGGVKRASTETIQALINAGVLVVTEDGIKCVQKNRPSLQAKSLF